MRSFHRRGAVALALFACLVMACEGKPPDLVVDCAHGDCGPAQRQCDQGEAAMCMRLGTLFEQGSPDRPADYGRAATAYEKGCLKSPFVCATACDLGMRLAYGKPGYPKDPELAGDLFEKACDGDWARGCIELGLLHKRGAGGRKKSHRMAASLFGRACAMGHSMEYHTAESVAYDGSARSDGCQELAEMYFTGEGVRKNQALASELFYRADMLQSLEDRKAARLAAQEAAATQIRMEAQRAAVVHERAEGHPGLDLALGIGGRMLLAPLVGAAIIGVPGALVAVEATNSVQAGVALATMPNAPPPRGAYGRGPAGMPASAGESPCASQCDLDANRCNLGCDAASPMRIVNATASDAFFACTTACEVSAMDCRCRCSASLCGS